MWDLMDMFPFLKEKQQGEPRKEQVEPQWTELRKKQTLKKEGKESAAERTCLKEDNKSRGVREKIQK